MVAGVSRPHQLMNLNFIKPVSSEVGGIRVSPTQAMVVQGTKDWDFMLVGQFLDSKLPFNVVSSITRKLWKNEGLLDVLSRGNGSYLFRFSHERGCKAVLDGGPWLIAGRHIFLRKWKRGLNSI